MAILTSLCMRGRGKYLFTSLFLPVIVFSAACGIPSTSYLPPVSADSVESPLLNETTYSFFIPSPDTIAAEVFEGFEIYYKLIPSESAADYSEGDPDLLSPISWNNLITAGYERLSSSAETATALPEYPLILLSSSDKSNPELVINLAFSNAASAVPGTTYGAGVSFKRSYENTSGERILKSFTATDFEVGDADLPIDFDPSSYDITIVLYIMSYGNDYVDLILNIHSSAAYLGKSLLLLN